MTKEERRALRKAFFLKYEVLQNVEDAAEAVGISEQTAYNWVRRYKANGGRIVEERARGFAAGTHRKLTPRQEKCLIRLITDKEPSQLKFPFAMWNSKAIKMLIEKEFGVTLSNSGVRYYMRRHGMSAQRPEKRAREADDKAVREWLKATYPEIKKLAKLLKAVILWLDETGVCTRETYMRGYAPKGKTPIVKVTSDKGCRVSMISAVSNRGDLIFNLYEGKLSILKYLRFIRGVIKDMGRPVILIADNLRIHHAKIVMGWLKKREDKVRMFFLPAYSPQLNPDEFANSYLKNRIGEREPASDKKQLAGQMSDIMTAYKGNRKKVKKLFRNKSVRYAA